MKTHNNRLPLSAFAAVEDIDLSRVIGGQCGNTPQPEPDSNNSGDTGETDNSNSQEVDLNKKDVRHLGGGRVMVDGYIFLG